MANISMEYSLIHLKLILGYILIVCPECRPFYLIFSGEVCIFQMPGCSIVAFTIELIHNSWDTIPVEGFKYSSSSLATDNMVRYGVQPMFLEVYTDRASIYMNKVLMVWHGSSSYFSKCYQYLVLEKVILLYKQMDRSYISYDINPVHVCNQQKITKVRKGESSVNLPTHYSTATIGVFWGHGLYDPTDPPTHR
ncbi:hypothetical protein LOTGIDRAFT_175220 [Lottia gigantea]|uniref:Uncharacterized protein n=1 Tax=Lottia gigantea TaxID=225164 RepID=V4ANK5_LOTGI|nr:hypothetical protein LOTGIDRAFT_175220 [Lottia gigantea]ESO95216.1 hypothetical protein LOTGIDRAFT_175220 [Lottia gigantea]